MTAQIKKGKKKMEPKIYVACLASYNSGILHGAYIDATLEPDDMLDLIGEMLEKSPVIGAEEREIHDFDDFDCIRIDRWEDLQHVHDIACFLVEKGELGARLLKELGENVDEARRVMDDDYIGEYNSIVEYAMERTADCYSDLPEFIAGYIDYKAMAEDLSHDLIEIELYGSVHLFHNT
jgi:antirestriction protein